VYQHGAWTDVPADDYRRHPKLEASFAGVERGELPHVDEWESVMDHLRRVVATHATWAGVERADLVADDFFDGPGADSWTFERPTGRKEMLRKRYEDAATTIFHEAASKLTTSVHDILRVIVQENGATYQKIAEETGLARSTVRYHVARLEEDGVLVRTGNPVLVVFSALALRDEAREKLRDLPDVRPDEPTIVVAGYPNVGKSTFVNSVTNARNETARYPFTTKQVHVGHVEDEYICYQIVDTPGLLDRAPEERNEIESQALSALTHLADTVLVFVDASGACGYPLSSQLALRDAVLEAFDVPVLTVCTKADRSRAVEADLYMSVAESENVEKVLETAIDAVGYEPELPYEG